ncbi:MFS transporter [bacterium]|nr:MFS transporter [bacterium]
MIKINKTSILIYTISCASFMVNLDTYIVNVALPSITNSFGAVTSDISWIVMAYNLMVVSLLLIFGKLGDTIGLKMLFITGFGIFTISSLMCGFSNSVLMLICSRFIQGIGASILYALPQAMIAKYLPQKSRGMAFGILAGAAALGITLGAPISAFITEFLSWRWIFFINLPIGVLSIIFLNYSISGTIYDKNKNNIKFDYLGAVLSFICVLCSVLFINRGGVIGWLSKEVILFLIISLVFFMLFIKHLKNTENQLLNLSLFTNLNFDYANMAMFLVSAYLSATNFLIPFYLSHILKFSTVQMGFLFMIYSLSYLVASFISGKVSNKVSLKLMCAGSMFVLSLNILGLVFSMNFASKTFLYPFFVISGITMSFFITSNNNLVMKMAKRGEEGMIAGVHRLVGRVGMLFGVALFEAFYSLNLKFGDLQAYKNSYLLAMIICLTAVIFSLIIKTEKNLKNVNI